MHARLAATLCLTLSLLVVPAPPAQGTQWQPRMAVAVRWAEGRAGEVSIAVLDTRGNLYRYRGGRDVPAASVLKVMFMAAYLRHPSVRDRALNDNDRALLDPMIRKSANAPATRIADMLGPRWMRRLARRAGMVDFEYRRPWGLTTTSARDQARFLGKLPRYIPDRHEPYALNLLNNIVPSQRWGIGDVNTNGWRKHFKGGWGSGTGAVDHQVVRLQSNGRRIALAVMTTNSPSHDYGKATLRGVFARLLRDLPAG